MEFVVAAAMFVIVTLAGGVVVLYVARERRSRRIWRALSAPPDPYELHRKRYELTGDEDELEAMRNAVRKESE